MPRRWRACTESGDHLQQSGKPKTAAAARQFLSAGLSLLRGVTGDDAYEKYAPHMARTDPGATLMTARDFFRAQQERQWSCINGCC